MEPMLGSKAQPIAQQINVDAIIQPIKPSIKPLKISPIEPILPKLPQPLPVPPVPPPLPPPPQNLQLLIHKVQQQLHQERNNLYNDAIEANIKAKANTKAKSIQATKTLLLAHEANNVLADKTDNNAEMVSQLSNLHEDRLVSTNFF